MTSFDYDKALEAAKADPFVKNFLEINQDRFKALTDDVVIEIAHLFAAGDQLKAWKKFYSKDVSWETLAAGAAEDVTNTASMAKRWNDLAQYLEQCGIMATKALITILVAGFCG